MNNNLPTVNSENPVDIMSLAEANSIYALLQGKKESTCRTFDRNIIVKVDDLVRLNTDMRDKLSLHSVTQLVTHIDVMCANKKVYSYKSWTDFQCADFQHKISPIRSVYVEWDFFIKLEGYANPQRHKVSVRLTTALSNSDTLKLMLAGGFDMSEPIDIDCCHMYCKVDFINNTLAEELINVVDAWNASCENRQLGKKSFRFFLYSYRNGLAHLAEILTTITTSFLIAILIKYTIIEQITALSAVFLLLITLPVYKIVTVFSHRVGQLVYNKFYDIMDSHIFCITKGDQQELDRLKRKCGYVKELVLIGIDLILSIATSLVFFLLD